MNKASEYFSWAFLLVNTQMGLLKFGFGPYSTLNTDYGPTFCQVDKWPNYSTGTLPTATFYLRPATRFRARSAPLSSARACSAAVLPMPPVRRNGGVGRFGGRGARKAGGQDLLRATRRHPRPRRPSRARGHGTAPPSRSASTAPRSWNG
jgi:hypothetical protein